MEKLITGYTRYTGDPHSAYARVGTLSSPVKVVKVVNMKLTPTKLTQQLAGNQYVKGERILKETSFCISPLTIFTHADEDRNVRKVFLFDAVGVRNINYLIMTNKNKQNETFINGLFLIRI